MPLNNVTVPFPVSINLEGRRCVVIGDDREADEKEGALRESGALVQRVREAALLNEAELQDAFFVLSTPQDAQLSERLRSLADRYRFLLCCIDQPAFGFVSMAAIVKAGPVRIAVSTAGQAPRVGKLLKNGIQQALDERFARFIGCQSTLKSRNRRRYPDSSSKRREAMIAAARGFASRLAFVYPQWFEESERSRLPRVLE